MAVSINEVEYVAKLARLEFTDEEKINLVEDLNKILEYVEKLSEVNTDDVEPSTGPYPIYNALRDDLASPSLCREEFLSNAHESRNGYFRVPRIIE